MGEVARGRRFSERFDEMKVFVRILKIQALKFVSFWKRSKPCHAFMTDSWSTSSASARLRVRRIAVAKKGRRAARGVSRTPARLDQDDLTRGTRPVSILFRHARLRHV